MTNGGRIYYEDDCEGHIPFSYAVTATPVTRGTTARGDYIYFYYSGKNIADLDCSAEMKYSDYTGYYGQQTATPPQVDYYERYCTVTIPSSWSQMSVTIVY